MSWNFTQMLELFSKDEKRRLLAEGYFGVEREAQRISHAGDLALTPHPSVFGNKEQNKCITTDFSESQIEMITPTFDSVEEVYKSLIQLHQEVGKGIGDEQLWPFSMPPRLPPEEQIPIARFNNSEEGSDKEAYRMGLALRYGKKMQMISGIHYNFSFSEDLISLLFEKYGKGKDLVTFKNQMYLAVTRNFLRYRWLLIYLFGASPTCDSSYHSVIEQELKLIEKCCRECKCRLKGIDRYATSLRVSRFGYANTTEKKYEVFYNSIEEYISKLHKMLETRSRKFSKLEKIKVEGHQLNSNILQKESEFYSPIRLKQNVSKGETQLKALSERGVKYLEVRIIDINPFEKTGISLEQLYFLQVFMLFCLFEKSLTVTPKEFEKMNTNHHLTALLGRKDNLQLYGFDNNILSLSEYGESIFRKLRLIAELMDSGDGKYMKSIEAEYSKLADVNLLPSQRLQKQMKDNNEDFINSGIRQIKEFGKIEI